MANVPTNFAASVANSGETVIVGCKLPNGIHMDFVDPGKPLRRVSLRGTNSTKVVGGFGITKNVPKAYFDEWMARYKELPAVAGGLIFALGKEDSTIAKAKEMKDVKNGLEPLNPKNMPKQIQALAEE